ncbi:MAG: MobC family plasmid mobilization relaxosome protein [Oscillospiraceae bacterium]|nr:MobC family plasmid mobilization relaxosome protein [Oscillospiraceae bacterium]
MIKFRATPEEYALIQRKAELAGITSLSAYLRKMAIDGYVIKLELPELREMISLLRRSSNNLNQIARRVNSTGRVYTEDMADIMNQQRELWQCAKAILKKLASIA